MTDFVVVYVNEIFVSMGMTIWLDMNVDDGIEPEQLFETVLTVGGNVVTLLDSDVGVNEDVKVDDIGVAVSSCPHFVI